jgi:AcrR family transcriptional regulator
MSAEPATPRGLRTKRALVEAAARIFARDGFLEARIADIAREAGVATGSFYTYFDSKEEIFRAVVDELIDELYRASQVADLAHHDPRERIRETNRRFLEAFSRNAALFAVVAQVASIDADLRAHRQRLRQGFVDRAARGIRALQAAGRADPNLEAELAAALLCGMVERFAEVRHLLGERFDDHEALEAMTEIWVRAIGCMGAERDGS